VRLTALAVTAPAAENHRPGTPGRPVPAPRFARLPGPLWAGSRASRFRRGSPVLPADGAAVPSAGLAGHLASAAG
jgi:hypothetical protein